MPSQPGAAWNPVPGTPYLQSLDKFSKATAFGIDGLAVHVEVALLNGPAGTVNWNVMPGIGQRLVVFGFFASVVTVTANALVGMEMTLAGDARLGTADMAPNTFGALGPGFMIPASTTSVTFPSLTPAHYAVVSSEGDGATVIGRYTHNLPMGSGVSMGLLYAVLSVSDPTC